MADQRSLVQTGKTCLQVAKDVLRDINVGQTKEASAKLMTMQKDATVLASEAMKLAKRLEAVDKSYQDKDAELLRQIGNLGTRENELKGRKNSIQSTLDGQRSVLRDKESQLSSAEDNLRTAERKLREAIQEEKNIQIGSTIGGAVLGLFTGGVGFLVGAGVGAGIGAIVNACRDEEKDARSARDRRSSDVSSARSAVRQSESQISSLEFEISSLSSNIRSLEQQRNELHKHRDEIKTAIPILKKSTEFWLLFKQLSEHGGDRTTLLQKIVSKANEQVAVFKSQASQRTANTFFEAWESLEAMAADGSSDHMFSIDYTCVKCSTQSKALPHLNGADFICSTCNLEITN